jgi:hypothetical protein
LKTKRTKPKIPVCRKAGLPRVGANKQKPNTMKKQTKKLSLGKMTISNLNAKISAVQTKQIAGGLKSSISETYFANCVTVFCDDVFKG